MIVGALGRELVEAAKRRVRRRARARHGFTVRFVQEQSANTCSVSEQDSDRLEDIQVYRVQLRFDLKCDRPAHLRNVDLRYDWRSDPVEQHVWVGSAELATDESFRLRDPIPLTPEVSSRLEVRRRFLNADTAFFTRDEDEYRTVTVDCELDTEEGGQELLTITGRLRPGGKIEDVEARLLADDERARNPRRRERRSAAR